MTAEVAIMNKQAIALAADSAATFRTSRGQKIFTSAQKVFCLSDQHPVGVMVYGSASLLEVPWETIIKLYGKDLGTKKFKTLQEYGNSLLIFIEKNKKLFPKKEQNKYIRANIGGYLKYLRGKILDKIKDRLEQKEKISHKEIEKIVAQEITRQYTNWQKSDLLPGATKQKLDSFRKKYLADIRKIRKDTFEKLPVEQSLSNKLDKIAVWLFFKFCESITNKGESGLVIAGFGNDETFPSLVNYTVSGVADGFLKFKSIGNPKVTFDNGAAIVPFAQKEMVVRFMEGVDPLVLSFVSSGLRKFANEYPKIIFDKIKMERKRKDRFIQHVSKQTKKITDEFLQRFEDFRIENFVSPIITVVGVLPKNELALMAETLVTLTSFKRKVSLEDETVGGPIDVAIISKGDGFIWIKRKKYFEKEIQN